jgi:hypothetical protein
MNTPIQKIHDEAAEISKKKWEMLKALEKRERDFECYPNILCVFQTFNKSHLINRILRPFIAAGFKKIMLFADGCIDETVSEAQTLLTGKQHAVIALNDLHEIHNYRFAINSEWGRKSEFLLLMQDDDLYPDTFDWLDYGLEMMKRDPKLAVIGYRSGVDFQKMCPASPTFESDQFGWNGNKIYPPGGTEATLIEGADIGGGYGLNFQYCQTIIRAPHLIRIAEFLQNTDFDEDFEPYQDDDSNYCLQLWSKGFRVGLVGGARIARDVGIGGMRLSNALTINSRPPHTKRNHDFLNERYSGFINSGELSILVENANKALVSSKKRFLYL